MRLLADRLLPWLWFAGCWAVAIFFLFDATAYLNSDTSSELILSKLIAEEGNWVFSDNWFYSTELRVLNMQIIWAALFRLTDDWHLVRVAGTAVAYVLYLACFRFFLAEAGWKKIFPWAGGVLLLPFCLEYIGVVLVGAFYIMALTAVFLALGLLLRGSKVRENFLFCAAASVLLGFLTGLGGPRQVFVLYLPFFVSSLWLLGNFLEGGWRERCALALRQVVDLNSHYSRLCLLSFVSLLAASAGYLVNKLYLHTLFQYQTFAVHFQLPSAERVLLIFAGWLDAFGASMVFFYIPSDCLPADSSLLAAYAGVAAIALFLLLCFLRTLMRNLCRMRIFDASTVVSWYFLVAAVQFTLFHLFTDMGYASRYAIFYTVFAVPLLFAWRPCCTESARAHRHGSAFLCALYFGAAILLVEGGVLSVFANYVASGGERKSIADYLVQQGYKEGYATFWHANVLTELSNGKLDVWCVHDMQDRSKLYEWLQRKDHLGRKPEGKTFILMTREEGRRTQPADNGELRLLMCTDKYLIYGCNETDRFKE